MGARTVGQASVVGGNGDAAELAERKDDPAEDVRSKESEPCPRKL
jgi:hypothetical protein